MFFVVYMIKGVTADFFLEIPWMVFQVTDKEYFKFCVTFNIYFQIDH